jgi:hypothetical protein
MDSITHYKPSQRKEPTTAPSGIALPVLEIGSYATSRKRRNGCNHFESVLVDVLLSIAPFILGEDHNNGLSRISAFIAFSSTRIVEDNTAGKMCLSRRSLLVRRIKSDEVEVVLGRYVSLQLETKQYTTSFICCIVCP